MTFEYTPPTDLALTGISPTEVTFDWAPSVIIGTQPSLLLHFDSVPVIDSSVNDFPMTTGATPVIDTAAMFGAASLLLDSAAVPSNKFANTQIFSGDPIDILSANGDFTVEFFFRVDNNNTTNLMLLDYGDDGVSFGGPGAETGFAVLANLGGTVLEVQVGTSIVDSVTSITWSQIALPSLPLYAVGTWLHFAISRQSGIVFAFLNGVLGNPGGTSWENFVFPVSTNSILCIGTSPSRGSGNIGHIDEFQVVKGLAKYTANFTPPSAPFPNPTPSGYIVYRDGVEIGQVTSMGTVSFTDPTVAVGNTYTYTVKAQDGSNNPESDFSAPLIVTITGALFGAFAASVSYAPIMLSNLAGIKPRIYVPIQSNTVSTKQ